MSRHSAAHTSFDIKRRFSASPARVFHAWADPEAKKQWSDCHAESGSDYHLDFRVGGRETHRVTLPNGKRQFIDKTFLEIVPDARVIFAYTIAVDGHTLSASLVTVEFKGDASGTELLWTEQLAYLDGHEDLQERIRGTGEGLDRLMLDVTADIPAA